MRSRRFTPIVTTPGLEGLLRPRRFAGLEPEDGLDCRVLSWKAAGLTTVLLSPAPLDNGHALAAAFEQAANHHYIELLAKRQVSARSAIRWVQHWPGRKGAPAPFDVDHFENVQLRPTRGRLEVVARQLVEETEVLSGLQAALGLANAQ